MFFELAKSVALLLSLAMVYGFIRRKWPDQQPIVQILAGCVFGFIAIIGMRYPILVEPGILIDARSMVLSIGSVFGGTVVGIVSGLLAGGYRIWVGGDGAPPGLVLIVMSVSAGLLYRYLVLSNRIRVSAISFLVLGFFIHTFHVGLFFLLPESAVEKMLHSIALPLILALVPATVFLGLIFKAVEDDIETRRKLNKAQSEKTKALEKVIHVLAAALEARDPYTAGHEQNVAEIAGCIGCRLGYDENRLEGLRLAATVHDVGKIHVPSKVLTKPDKLTPSEWAVMQQHPDAGARFLSGIEFDWPIAEVIRQHHERLDGSGYPRGLTGDQILEEAKIVAVADVIDAMATDRPYRQGLGVDAARSEIISGRGVKYDADIVDICVDLIDAKKLFHGIRFNN